MRSWISNASWYHMVLAVSPYCVPIGLSSGGGLVKEGKSFTMESDLGNTRRKRATNSNRTCIRRQPG